MKAVAPLPEGYREIYSIDLQKDKKMALLVNPFVPAEWFWVVYMIQVGNLSGAAGDLFITVRFSRFPDDILVKDHGVGMTVFSRL